MARVSDIAMGRSRIHAGNDATCRKTRIAILLALAVGLSGCGYRELKAPCGPDEGGTPALSYAPLAQRVTGLPLDQLSAGGIPVVDPCGPLRSINAPRSPSGMML